MHFLDFPQHVSASNCHHQGGRSALEATQGLRPEHVDKVTDTLVCQ
jgi:hypothetical protein